MLLWLSLLFKRRRSSPHNVESAGRLTCAFYNLQLFQEIDIRLGYQEFWIIRNLKTLRMATFPHPQCLRA